MQKHAEQILSKAKAKLLVEYPYFGTLASKIELVVNDNLESFKSDGLKLEYAQEYLESLELAEVEFILANGAMHASLAHQQRKNNRSGWLWQMATDIAINDMLIQNGLALPYGAQYRKRFAGMYAEEIYAELKADILRDDEDLEYEADDIEDVEDKNTQSKSQEQIQEELLQEALFAQEAISLLESKYTQEEMPASIERFFKLQENSQVDWREELREAIEMHFRDDFVMMPPSKKLLSQGIYLPSSISNTFRLVIAIDSSGSIDESLLNTFLSEVDFLLSLVQNYEITLLVCDDKIHSVTQFYTGDALRVSSLKGGGGTDFRPVFSYVEENIDMPKLLLYFSDLEGIFPNEPPSYTVKWVVPKELQAPFGEFIVLGA